VPDVASRLPGRGLWLTPRREVLESAIARRLFARSARRPVAIPVGLADRVENMLVQRCCDLIGLARRAGLAVAGLEKVREAVRAEKAGLLVLALDGAEGGRRKTRSLGRELPVVMVLTAAEMGATFGRDHVVNVAIGSGALSGRVIGVAEKIAGFRPGALIDRATEPA
jgi:ribosomal protein L7Ae-like RNA K-turn-binding protein